MAAPKTLGSQNGKNNDYGGNPIGTGPFEFSSWDYTVKFVTTRNANYWRAGLPYLDQLEFHPIPDGPTRFSALQGGTVDIIHESEGDITKQFPKLNSSVYSWDLDFP